MIWSNLAVFSICLGFINSIFIMVGYGFYTERGSNPHVLVFAIPLALVYVFLLREDIKKTKNVALKPFIKQELFSVTIMAALIVSSILSFLVYVTLFHWSNYAHSDSLMEFVWGYFPIMCFPVSWIISRYLFRKSLTFTFCISLIVLSISPILFILGVYLPLLLMGVSFHNP